MLTILTLKMLLMIVYLAHWDWILTQSRKDIVSNISDSKFMAVCPIDVNKTELENYYEKTINWEISRNKILDFSGIINLRKIIKSINSDDIFHVFTLKSGLLLAFANLFKNNKYAIDSIKYISYKDTISYYSKIIKRYKIKSIEDPFAENDWKAWSYLNKKEKKTQIVGDDLYVTNLQRLKKGFLYQSSNSILIKLNQIGTVSETLDVIKFAQNIGYSTIISHRSGDSEDTFISDLAVGTNSNQIKTGSLCRSERVAKFNQLLRIEAHLIKSKIWLN